MAILPLGKAAKVAGTSRQTIYRYAKQGRLSTVQLHDGTLGVDTAELLRVFGQLSQPETVTSDSMRQCADTVGQAETSPVAALQAEIAGLHGKVSILERQVEASQDREHKLLGIIESQTRLIEHQAAPKEKPAYWWWFWVAVVLTILSLAAAPFFWPVLRQAPAIHGQDEEKPQPQKPPATEPKPQAPIPPLEPWKPDDSGG